VFSYNGQSTEAVPWDASPELLEWRLESLEGIEDVEVTMLSVRFLCETLIIIFLLSSLISNLVIHSSTNCRALSYARTEAGQSLLSLFHCLVNQLLILSPQQ
jgi:hypothetical protein